MKVVFNVDFRSQSRGSQGFARLETDMPCAPTTDMHFEHSAWKEPRKAMSVFYSVAEKSFYVILQYDTVEPKRKKQHGEMYQGHGWTVK